MLKVERQRRIRAFIEKQGVASVAELAREFGIAPITIRRDLDELDEQAVLTRTHGGAVTLNLREVPPAAGAMPYADREAANAREKMLIARAVAKRIKPGDSFILNAGTTSRRLAEALADRDGMRVITNGLTVAIELVRNLSSHVLLIGGVVDPSKMATVGIAAQSQLQDTHVPRAFLGVSGISVDGGITMFNPQEAEINRAFVAAASEITIMVDSSKFGAQAMYRIAPLSKIHRIVTDSGITSSDRARIRKLKIDLQIVDARKS